MHFENILGGLGYRVSDICSLTESHTITLGSNLLYSQEKHPNLRLNHSIPFLGSMLDVNIVRGSDQNVRVALPD